MVICCLWGCAHHKIASDLAKYINDDILSIAPLENRALSTYASVVGDNYSTDQAVYDALRHEVVPVYGQFVRALKSIRPKTDEVDSLHSLYINGAETMMHGFETKLTGLETGSMALIIEGNSSIEKGRSQTERWRTRLKTYYRKYGVEYKKANNA